MNIVFRHTVDKGFDDGCIILQEILSIEISIFRNSDATHPYPHSVTSASEVEKLLDSEGFDAYIFGNTSLLNMPRWRHTYILSFVENAGSCTCLFGVPEHIASRIPWAY